MDTTTKLSIAYRMYTNKLPVDGIAIACNVNRVTVYRWFKKFRHLGFYRTEAYYKNLRKKKRKRKIDPLIKHKILELRQKHRGCCGQKLQLYLYKETGIKVSLTTIYKVLKTKYTIKNTYKKNKYGEAPKGTTPRDVIQVDTVDFGDLYAFTYIDTYTR